MRVRATAIVAGLLVACGVLVFDPGGQSPHGPVKWLAVSTLATLAGGLLLARRRVAMVWRPTRWWLVFLAVALVASVLGLDRFYAFTGTPERNFGWLTWVLCGLCFLAGQLIDDDGDGRFVTLAAVATAGALGAWTIAEAFGWEPVQLDADPGRLLGPFGSSAFLGAAAVLLAPIATGVALDPSFSRRTRSLAAASAVAVTIGVIGSGARAAWVGAIVAVVLGIASSRRWWTGHPAVTVSALAVAMVTVFIVASATGVAGRIGGGASRVDEWRVAVRVLGDHPILGAGPEGYRIAFAGAVDASYEREYGRAVLPDRAHNGLLDVAVTTGLIGLLVYSALLVAVAKHVLRAMREEPPWVAGIAIGLAAYAVQQLFLFPIATLEPAVWLLAGLLVIRTARPDEIRVIEPHPMVTVAATATMTVAVGVALAGGGAGAVADRSARRSLQSLDDGRVTTAARQAARSVSLRPDVVRYRLLAARADGADGTIEGLDRALDDVDAALHISPADPLTRAERGRLLLARASTTRAQSDVRRARAYVQDLVAADPNNAELQRQLALAATLDGDAATAATAQRAAADLDPRHGG